MPGVRQGIGPSWEARPYFAILCLPPYSRILGTVLGTVESGRRYRGSMARITPIGDVLAARPMVRPVASIMAAVAVAWAVAVWVAYIGLLPSDLELPKDQASSDVEDQASLFDT